MGPPACKTGEQGVDTAYLMPGVPSFTSLARQTPARPATIATRLDRKEELARLFDVPRANVGSLDEWFDDLLAGGVLFEESGPARCVNDEHLG